MDWFIMRDKIKKSLMELKRCLAQEKDQTIDMLKIYKRYVSGSEVTDDELTEANKQIVDVIRTSGLSVLVMLPGSIITIPALIKFARKYNVELLPDSFLKDE